MVLSSFDCYQRSYKCHGTVESYEVWIYFCGSTHFLDVFIVILLISLILMFNYYTYITVTKLVTSFDMTVSH